MKNNWKKINFSVLTAFGAIVVIVFLSGRMGAGEYLNNYMTFGYGGGALVLQPITAVNQPLYIPFKRDGRLFHKASNNMLADLEIPPQAYPSWTENQNMIFEAEDLLADSVIEPQHPDIDVFVVGDRVFNFSAKTEDGKPVRYFPNKLTLSITVPELPESAYTDMGVYYLNANNVWRKIDQARFNENNKATVHIDVLSVVAVLRAPGLPDNIQASGNFFPARQILGVKKYAENTLLRNPKGEIYIVKGDHLTHVPSLAELRKYAGRPIINVDQQIIDFYLGDDPIVDDLNRRPAIEKAVVLPDDPGVTYYADGAYVRTPDNKVYLVENPTVRHIATLPKNITQYSGRRIYEIEFDDLEQYRLERIVDETETVKGARAYGEGTLLRTRDWKVYIIQNNDVKHIATIPGPGTDTYQGKKIYDVDYGELDKYRAKSNTVVTERVLGIKKYSDGTLLRTPDGKIYIIENQKARHILTIDEFRSYGNRPVLNVNYDVIEEYNRIGPVVKENNGEVVGGPQRVLGIKQYADGTLLRTRDWKVYRVENQEVRLIATIPGPADSYKGDKILDVDYAVIAEYQHKR